MLLTINGKKQELETVSTLHDLLGKLELDPQMVVVELNEKVIRRSQIQETALTDGDTVEILRFVGGG